MIAFLLAVALAGDMDVVAPAAVGVATGSVPQGPPIDATAEAGADLSSVLAGLPAGSRLRLGEGTHVGPFVVDRPLELYGAPGAVITGSGRGTVLVVASPDVWVHDLHVTGGGRLPQQDDAGLVVAADRFRIERVLVDDAYLGIDVRLASDGVVRDCIVRGDPLRSFGLRGDGIRLWEAHRNVVEGNVLEHVRDLVIWYSDDNVIRGNHVSGSRYGTHLMHTRGNDIVENVFSGDVVGVFTMYSDDVRIVGNTVTGSKGAAGVALGFKESDDVLVEDNLLVDNTTGIYVDTTPHRNGSVAGFSGNLIGANEVGLRIHGPQAGAVFEGNAFVGNVASVAVDGGGDATGSSFLGNEWSEYAGYDLDHDGVGDLPFELRAVASRLRDRRADLAYFTATPASSLLDLFAMAFPMFAPRPLLSDAAPAMPWSTR